MILDVIVVHFDVVCLVAELLFCKRILSNSSWLYTPLKIEHHCVIKFCVNANMTPTDALKFMQKGDSNVSRSLVFGWHNRLRDGLEDVSDRPRTGRPGRREQDDMRIRDAISEGRRRSVREISDMTGI